ncbi:MAG: hypothetical protein FWC69_04835 [Defluviitaleaceae bacterium]|nr:hypothetical protein [Defluviitaleaceae bacterium]
MPSNLNGKILKGSQTARDGFKNEKDVALKFNNWENDIDARDWLVAMNYKLENIEYVKAVVISGHKSDLNVQIKIKLKDALDIENIQVKLVSNKKGFNQIDKRYLKNYITMWNMPDDVYKLLQYFCGEVKPYKKDVKDPRRMFITELEHEEQDIILEWFKKNKFLIISDCIKGRGELSVEWVLVAQKTINNQRWVLRNINEVLNHYSQGEVCISPRGSLRLGRITMQRKGGDGGRETANMLQFKLDPTELFEI